MPDTTQSSPYAGTDHTVGEEFSNRNELNAGPLTRRVDSAHLTSKSQNREATTYSVEVANADAIQTDTLSNVGSDSCDSNRSANVESRSRIDVPNLHQTTDQTGTGTELDWGRELERELSTDVESEQEAGGNNDKWLAERERILCLHAADLIAELQNWAEQIDTRESQLNTRDALLDQRERQFRTWEKFKKQEIDDTIRLTERLQQEAKDRLKRVAALELGAVSNL
jgi:hypothetical protein